MAEALEADLPFCVYQKPGSGEVCGVFQWDPTLGTTTDFKGRGFVMAPFDLERGIVLIRPDAVLRAPCPRGTAAAPKRVPALEEGREAHLELVVRGLREIKGGALKKVVLSKRWELPLSKGPIELFQNLVDRYPDAFCYLFHHPRVGRWCGATPESLVEIGEGELRGMSLAGTLPYRSGMEPQWGEKELEEQNMVTDYIGERLGPFMERLERGQLESVRAGQLWHLRSRFKGTLRTDADLGKLIASLHPTPAVGGVPKQAAVDFIREHEPYDRSFYTGFLGELNLDGERDMSLFVNLRCMELKGNRAFVHAGGGITADSRPEEEWTEIQNKAGTVQGIL